MTDPAKHSTPTGNPDAPRGAGIELLRMVGGVLGVATLLGLLVASFLVDEYWADAFLQTARVSSIAVAFIGGFAVVMGVLGMLVRTVIPDRAATRWAVGIVAGLAWLAFVRWLWRLPIVTDVGDVTLSGRITHAVHDATLAQASARMFAAVCIGVAASVALGGLRWDRAHRARTIRHLLGATALLFGLGAASTAVVDRMSMLGLNRPEPSLMGDFIERYLDTGDIDYVPLVVLVVTMLACVLVAAWLMTARHGDPDARTSFAWQHTAAVGLTSLGIAFALARQLLLTTISDDRAMQLQWVAAVLVVAALAILVFGRVQRGERGFDLGTATWFVLLGAIAVLLHWPAQDHLERRIADDLDDYPGVLVLLETETERSDATPRG